MKRKKNKKCGKNVNKFRERKTKNPGEEKEVMGNQIRKKERKHENTRKDYSKGKCIIHSSIYKKNSVNIK